MKNSYHKGFTVIELMVTTAIFAFVSAFVFSNYPLFSSRITLENLTQQIALTARQAQVYGSSARAGTAQTYGVYFFTTAVGSNGSKEFYIFEDRDGDKFMDSDAGATEPNACNIGAGQNECLEKVRIAGNESILLLCQGLKSLNPVISPLPKTTALLTSQLGSDTRCTSRTIHATYTRPSPDATIKDTSAGTTDGGDTEIFVGSPRGDVKAVIIWSTGQISTE